MSRGSDSRQTTKGKIIRMFEFLLSERKSLTKGNGLSHTAPADPGIKAYMSDCNTRKRSPDCWRVLYCRDVKSNEIMRCVFCSHCVCLRSRKLTTFSLTVQLFIVTYPLFSY